MRTQGAFFADTAHGGGLIFYDAAEVNVTGTNFALTKNALGDYSYNLIANQAGVIVCGLADIKRLIESAALAQKNLPFQEKFGTASLTPGWPAGAQSLPPFTGSTQLTPNTGDAPKGLQILDCTVIYLVTGAAATTNVFSLNRTVFANNVANSITNLAVTGTLATATQANPYVTKLTVNTPVFETTDNADIVAEINVATTTGGAYRFYGIAWHVNFNFD